MLSRHRVDDRRDDPSDGRDGVPADPHTRRVIDNLRRADGPVDVADLATQVVADLTGQPSEDVPSNVRRRVQTWLHHGQLPALAEHGLVEYDPDRGTVRLVRESPERSIGTNESADRP